MQTADVSFPGLVSTGIQTFSGTKSFLTQVTMPSLNLLGSTSGNLQLFPAATTTSYSLVLPAAQGAAGTVPVNDGAGNLSWQSVAGSLGPFDQFGVIYAYSTTQITSTPIATPGYVLTGVGAYPGTLPTWEPIDLSGVGTVFSNLLPVSYGGTGAASTTAYGVLLGGTTSTSAFQNAGTGTIGQVLISQGPSAVPIWQTPGGGIGTVTSVGLSDGSSTPIYDISGSPVTSSGTLSFTLKTQAANLVLASATSGGSAQPIFRSLVAADIPLIPLGTGVTGTLAINHGGTGSNSVISTPTATSWAGWDANKNLFANNFVPGYTTTVSSATPVVLTNASTYYQEFTGTAAQHITLPVVSTLQTGFSFIIINATNQGIEVDSSGGGTVLLMTSTNAALFTCISTSGTTPASWNVQILYGANGTSTNDVLQMAQGGTGANAFATDYGVVISRTTSSIPPMLTSLASVGSSGQVLTSNGVGAQPSFQSPVGTVTSVAMTVPAFLSVSGTPITSSGTLAVTLSGTALPVANGGTGDTSLTAYAVLAGGTTSTGALQQISGVGTTGQVLTSNGASTLPTWQTPAGGSGFFYLAAGPTSVYGGTNATLSFTGAGNTVVGVSAGGQLTSGGSNTLFGWFAGDSIITGAGNTFIGTLAGTYLSGQYNVALGDNSGTGYPGGSNSSSISLGAYASAASNGGIAIGTGVITSFANSIVIAPGDTQSSLVAGDAAANQLAIGDSRTDSFISSIFLGRGAVAVASPQAVKIALTPATGSNVAGSALQFSLVMVRELVDLVLSYFKQPQLRVQVLLLTF